MAKTAEFFERVAQTLIDKLKEGTAPWQQGWDGSTVGSMPMNPTTGNRYRGGNTLFLMMQGYDDPRWMTYRQAEKQEAQVKKGEHGTPIIYWKFEEEQTKTDSQGKPIMGEDGKPLKQTVELERPRAFLSYVFNAEQIEGLPPLVPKLDHQWQMSERAESILANSQAKIEHREQGRAFYRPNSDTITLPTKGQFFSEEKYYSTALHELGHWTGHESRLNRDLHNPFGSEGYAREELRAEIASFMLGQEVGSYTPDTDQHAAYVAFWIKALEEDPREIFRAAADAEKILDYVMAFDLKQEQKAVQEVVEDASITQNDSQFIKITLHNDATGQENIMNFDSWEAAYTNCLHSAHMAGEEVEEMENHEATVRQHYARDGATIAVKQAPSQRQQTTLADDTVERLKFSTLTPGIYEPTEDVRTSLHVAIFVEKKPLLLLGWHEDANATRMGEQLLNNSEFRYALEQAKEHGPITAGIIDGKDIDWKAQHSAIVKSVSGEVENGKGHGELQAIFLKDEFQRLATFCCICTSVAQTLDPDCPNLETTMGREKASIAEQATPAEAEAQRVYLSVPYTEKNEAKALGAKWDRKESAWYVPQGRDSAAFEKWFSPVQEKIAPAQNKEHIEGQTQDRVYLAVPYMQRGEAKAVGAQWDSVAKSWYAGDNGNMEKLVKWLPNQQAEQAPAMSPREEFGEALRALGCKVEGEHPVMDGRTHRIATEGDSQGGKSGFYVGHLDGHPAGYAKNNRSGDEIRWKSQGTVLSAEGKKRLASESEKHRQEREQQIAQSQEKAAVRVQYQMGEMQLALQKTPYLEAKGLELHKGVLVGADGKTTCLPAQDAHGKIWTMQYIQEDGTKRFAKEARKEGCFHCVGGMTALDKAPVLVISEGYATASTLASALGHGTIAAFDAGNLESVAKALHEKFPQKAIVIAGDDDRHLQSSSISKNPGREKAEHAAQSVGGIAVFPIFAQAETGRDFKDFNDLGTKSILGSAAVARQLRPTIEKAEQQRKAALTQSQEQQNTRTHGR